MSNNQADKIFYFIQGFLLYGIVLSLIYYFNHYIGMMLNTIFLAMIASVMIISIISELLERSKISPLYFYTIAGILLSAIVLMGVFSYEL